MPAEQLKHLIKQANQIANNQHGIADQEQVISKVYEHLNKFWSPLMKEQIREYVNGGQGELCSEAYQAALKL